LARRHHHLILSNQLYSLVLYYYLLLLFHPSTPSGRFISLLIHLISIILTTHFTVLIARSNFQRPFHPNLAQVKIFHPFYPFFLSDLA